MRKFLSIISLRDTKIDTLQTARERRKRIFMEDFSGYEPGPFSEGYNASGEFYYLIKKVDQGPWQEISAYHTWNKRANPDYPNWRIVFENNTKSLMQTLTNPLTRRNLKYFVKRLFFRSRLPLLYCFPALVLGDPDWTDYLLSVRLRPLSKNDFVGVIFRMIDSQNHYVFALKKNRAYLIYREYGSFLVLATRWFPYEVEKDYVLSVAARENHVFCFINEKMVFERREILLKSGKVGLMANVPALFGLVEVYSDRKDRYEEVSSPKKTKTGKFRSSGTMELYKKIRIQNLCSGRFLRFGDLTGNGKVDLLLAQGKPVLPGNDYNSITCLTAVDLNGNILWQRGSPSFERRLLSSDLPFQIYDIDGDGANEVICAYNFNLEILDGRTGKLKGRIGTPKAVNPTKGLVQIVGDSIAICNLSGRKRARDILIKDRYSKIWAYNNNLELLWEYQSQREMGHYPFTTDLDKDGKDEVLVGYSLLRPSGRKIWELLLRDHADAVAVVKDDTTNTYKVLIAASDEGFIVADLEGKIRRHLRIGHMQTVTVANLIPGSSAPQIATNTYWGNPGIVFILDLDGNILKTFQPSLYGSPLRPVRWFEDGCELILLSAAPDKTGGLYNGLGEQKVSFPEDGHPTLCYDAFDIDGDGFDELICWDYDELWIYTRGDKPQDGVLGSIERVPPLYNASNYRAYVSIYK